MANEKDSDYLNAKSGAKNPKSIPEPLKGLIVR